MHRTLALILAICISTLYFVFNLSILNRMLDLDIVHYYHDVESFRIFHPHHLLYTSTGRWLLDLSRIYFDYSHSSMFIMQMMNLGGSSLLLGAAFYLMNRISGRILLSLAITACIAFSYGYWIYSHINDTAILPAGLALVSVLLAIRISQIRSRWIYAAAVLLGFIHFLAMGFHQTNLLLYVPLILILFFPRPQRKNITELGGIRITERLPQKNTGDPDGRDSFIQHLLLRRLYAALLFVFISLGSISSLYYYAGHIHMGMPFEDDASVPISGIPHGGNFFDWFFLYGHWDDNIQWGTLERRGLHNAAASGAGRAILHSRGNLLNFQNSETPDEFILQLTESPQKLLITGLLVFLLIFPFSIPLLLPRWGIVPFAAYVWFLLFAALVVWWEPYHFEFWVHPSVAMWLCLFLFADGIASLFRVHSLFNYVGEFFVSLLPAVLALVLFAINYPYMKADSERISFGHWEDIFIKENYTGLLNSLYQKPVPVQVIDPERQAQNRLALIQALRRQMHEDNAGTFFRTHRMRFGNAYNALQRMFPERAEYHCLYDEWQRMQAGREAWIEYIENPPEKCSGPPPSD